MDISCDPFVRAPVSISIICNTRFRLEECVKKCNQNQSDIFLHNIQNERLRRMDQKHHNHRLERLVIVFRVCRTKCNGLAPIGIPAISNVVVGKVYI